MAVERLKEPERFWERLDALPTIREDPPSSATKALCGLMPGSDFKYRIVHRVVEPGQPGTASLRRAGTMARRQLGARGQRAYGLGLAVRASQARQTGVALPGSAGSIDPLSRSLRQTPGPLDRAPVGAGLLAHRAVVAPGQTRLGAPALFHGLGNRQRPFGQPRGKRPVAGLECPQGQLAAYRGTGDVGIGSPGLGGLAEDAVESTEYRSGPRSRSLRPP